MKIRNQLFIFVIIMSLILTACGGKSSIGNILSDTTSPPSSETPNQSQGVSTSTSDVSIGLDEQFEPRPRPADGDFWISIISGNNADSFQQARIITLRNVKGFHILYAGDTSAKIPDITNVKLIKNGNPQDVSFTLDDTNYCEIDNSTVAIYFFDRIYTEDGIYWVEFDVDGFRATSQKSKIDGSYTTPTPSITEAKSIMELTINPSGINLTDVKNANGTVMFTYTDTSIKQQYKLLENNEHNTVVSFYSFNVYVLKEVATAETYFTAFNTATANYSSMGASSIWFEMIFTTSKDTINVMDVIRSSDVEKTGMGSIVPLNNFAVSIDENGLTATWNKELNDGELAGFGIWVEYSLRYHDEEQDMFVNIQPPKQEFIFFGLDGTRR